MLRPVGLKVRGFRGFVAEQEVSFTGPMVLLLGENHQGKSSTMNAIEWCLYGDECYGGNSGIRERVSWEIANRYQSTVDVMVELRLEDGDASYVLRRSLRALPKKAKPQQDVTLALPDRRVLVGSDAEQALRRVVRASFRDFTTTVYQHQEVIRALLTEEPRRRNDALDRLLGLAAHRNLIAAIDGAGVRTNQRQVVQSYNGFLQQVQTALNIGRNELAGKRRGAHETGLRPEELTPAAALSRAGILHAGLAECARGIGARLPSLKIPSDRKDLEGFIKGTRAELKRLFGEIPEAKGQARLLARRQQLLALQADYVALHRRREEGAKRFDALTASAGGPAALPARLKGIHAEIEEARQAARKANARRSLVREALATLETAGPPENIRTCPLCGNRADDLLAHLKEEYEQTTAQDIRQVESARKTLEAQAELVREALAEHDRLAKATATLEAQLGKIKADVAAAIEQPLDLFADPLALLNRELETIDAALQRTQEAVEARRQGLDRLDEDVERLEAVNQVVGLEEKRRGIERIRDTLEFRRLDALRDDMARWIADVDSVKLAIGRDSNEYARRKIREAQQRIDGVFRLLTGHPAISELKLHVAADATGKNTYTFSGPDGRDLVPVLSQGDMNALALAIFLGLSRSGDDAGRFGFVMLDDPSQSLGTTHKRQLVEVLNEFLSGKMVILSTMDRELEDMLRRLIIPMKHTLRFSDWSPTRGPRIDDDRNL